VANLAPYLEQDEVTLDSRKLTDPWSDWFQALVDAVNAAPSTKGKAKLATQAASIAATDLTDGAFPAGMYRVTYYARITQAATTSSSLTVTIDWTDGAVGQSQAGAAMTGNTTTTIQSGSVLLRSDKAKAITYTTTYASVGATVMQYSLDLTLERVAE